MKTAELLGIVFYSLTIILHVFILSGIIPLTWVNGGRSASIATQFPISILNIFISIIGVVFTLFVSRNVTKKYRRGISVICWLFVVLWSVGFVQQLLGTPFEKMICSLILLLGIIANFRMAIENLK